MEAEKPRGDGPHGPSDDGGIDRQMDLPVQRARFRFVYDVSSLPDLGIWKMSLPEAADLVAVDMFGSGLLAVEIPNLGEEEVLLRDDPRVLNALTTQRKLLVERMQEAVALGSLPTVRTRRDILTGAILPEGTVIDYDALLEWVGQFDYEPGDWMAGYLDHEASVLDDLANALFDIRNIRSQLGSDAAQKFADRQSLLRRQDAEVSTLNGEKTVADLHDEVKEYAAQIAVLKNELQRRQTPEPERALNPKTRNTLYRIIAALCFAAKVNPNDRHAVAAVEKLTQRAGLFVGDDTIRKVLAELPEADASGS